jgi:hypothetical protein
MARSRSIASITKQQIIPTPSPLTQVSKMPNRVSPLAYSLCDEQSIVAVQYSRQPRTHFLTNNSEPIEEWVSHPAKTT